MVNRLSISAGVRSVATVTTFDLSGGAASSLQLRNVTLSATGAADFRVMGTGMIRLSGDASVNVASGFNLLTNSLISQTAGNNKISVSGYVVMLLV